MLILGAPTVALAEGGDGGSGGSSGGDSGGDSGGGQTHDPKDRNRNGKQDWHEKGWFGQNDCEKATTIRDAGATVALGSAAGGFGPGIVVGGMIGVWGQFMVWNNC